MTKEEKDLLLQDLCARLPYGVKVYNEPFVADLDNFEVTSTISKTIVEIIEEGWKPYLRPMSSMTATESIEYQKRVKVIQDVERTLHWCDTPESIDWLDEHHFDYRGLIGKGLALEAPDGMYKF